MRRPMRAQGLAGDTHREGRGGQMCEGRGGRRDWQVTLADKEEEARKRSCRLGCRGMMSGIRALRQGGSGHWSSRADGPSVSGSLRFRVHACPRPWAPSALLAEACKTNRTVMVAIFSGMPKVRRAADSNLSAHGGGRRTWGQRASCSTLDVHFKAYSIPEAHCTPKTHSIKNDASTDPTSHHVLHVPRNLPQLCRQHPIRRPPLQLHHLPLILLPRRLLPR